VAGATAALLGLAATGVPVLACWLLSAPPQDGVTDAARLAGAIWLLAHGGPLGREPGGAPLSITPLTLTALCLLLVARAGARAAAQAPPGRAPAACGALSAGYLAVALPVALGCRGAGALRAEPLPDLLAVAVLVWPTACLGARTGFPGWPTARRRLRAWQGRADESAAGDASWWERRRVALAAWPARCLSPLPVSVVLPTVGAWLLVLLAGGALLVATAAALREAATEAVVHAVAGGSPAGHLGLLLSCLLVLPNAVLWAVGYTLGPGFRLAADSLVAPGQAQSGPLPAFPLLALAPETGSEWQRLAHAVPVLAGVVVAVLLGRAAAVGGGEGEADGPWSAATTARTAAVVALLSGAAVAAAGWLAGGALGAGRMARLGPALGCGPAAAAWCLLLAVPLSLLVRWWALRRARAVEADGEWAAES
jgi:hypothetical protein